MLRHVRVGGTAYLNWMDDTGRSLSWECCFVSVANLTALLAKIVPKKRLHSSTRILGHSDGWAREGRWKDGGKVELGNLSTKRGSTRQSVSHSRYHRDKATAGQKILLIFVPTVPPENTRMWTQNRLQTASYILTNHRLLRPDNILEFITVQIKAISNLRTLLEVSALNSVTWYYFAQWTQVTTRFGLNNTNSSIIVLNTHHFLVTVAVVPMQLNDVSAADY